MVAGLLAALGLSVALDTAIPALPFVAAGFLAPNLDRIVRRLSAVRRAAPGEQPDAAAAE
jgi:hypothetical protein